MFPHPCFPIPSDCNELVAGIEAQKLGDTPQKILDHKGLQSALDTWSWVGRICNFHTERLLALFRKACPKRPMAAAERFVSAGTICQVLRCHRIAGGRDPRSIKRSQLLAAGVGLACKTKSRKENKRRSLLSFVNKRRSELCSAGVKRSREELSGSTNRVAYRV